MVSDQIFLRDHIVDFEIGAFSEERGKSQRLTFTVVVDVPGGGDVDDDVDRILSYDTILNAIEAEIRDRRVDLLETLAEGIATRILSEPLARRVRIRIEKIDRVSGRLGIEIMRERGAGSVVRHGFNRPVVHCIGNAGKVPGIGKGAHILLVQGQPQSPVGDKLISRRLDLLACEAAGWELASRLNGVDVVATRTELDHAIKSENCAIWAPSKMVFDAGDGVESVPTDVGELAVWFGTQLNAREIRFYGVEIPDTKNFDGDLIQGVET